MNMPLLYSSTDGMTSRTLVERAYAELRQHIVEGLLPPDEKLRVEHLKDKYQVGAGTLREALTRLVSDSLVIAEGQRGFRVAPMTLADLEDITRVRLHVEIEAVRLSIRHGDAAWKTRLRQTFEAMHIISHPISPNQRMDYEKLNRAFHEVLTSGYHSPRTQQILSQLSRHGERYRRYTISLQTIERNIHQEHTDIYEAAIKGNETRAALALETHIVSTVDLIRNAVNSGKNVFAKSPVIYNDESPIRASV